jgi:hypothetical protein
MKTRLDAYVHPAFQAEFRLASMYFGWPDQTRDRHLDVLDQSVWLVGPILAP